MEYFDDDAIVNDDVVNADARIDNDMNIARVFPPRAMTSRRRRDGRRADADDDDDDGYIDGYKKYLCIRLYTVLYPINAEHHALEGDETPTVWRWTVDTTTPLCPSHDES